MREIGEVFIRRNMNDTMIVCGETGGLSASLDLANIYSHFSEVGSNCHVLITTNYSMKWWIESLDDRSGTWNNFSVEVLQVNVEVYFEAWSFGFS